MSESSDIHVTQMGTTFSRSTDGSTYAVLTDVSSIEPPKKERDGSDDTTLTSTSEISSPAYFDKISQATIGMYLTEAQAVILQGDWSGKTNPLYAKITWVVTGTESAGPTYTFQYWVKSFDPGKAEKKNVEKVMSTMVLERTTTPVYTAGS